MTVLASTFKQWFSWCIYMYLHTLETGVFYLCVGAKICIARQFVNMHPPSSKNEICPCCKFELMVFLIGCVFSSVCVASWLWLLVPHVDPDVKIRWDNTALEHYFRLDYVRLWWPWRLEGLVKYSSSWAELGNSQLSSKIMCIYNWRSERGVKTLAVSLM